MVPRHMQHVEMTTKVTDITDTKTKLCFKMFIFLNVSTHFSNHIRLRILHEVPQLSLKPDRHVTADSVDVLRFDVVASLGHLVRDDVSHVVVRFLTAVLKVTFVNLPVLEILTESKGTAAFFMKQVLHNLSTNLIWLNLEDVIFLSGKSLKLS